MKLLPSIGILVASALIAACSGGPSPSPAPSVAGRTFLSTKVEGRTFVEGTRVRLVFQDGGLSASAGCNTMGGQYQIDGGRLVVGQLGSTEMACDPPLMEQDRWLAELLTGGSAVTLDGDTLILEGSLVRLTLQDRETADPDRPLEGTRWVVEGIVTGDAVSSLPAGVVAAIRIADGRAHVEAGCNGGGAPVVSDEGALTFGELVLTAQLCEPGVMSVEDAVLAVLSGTVAYSIEADVLTLDAGGRGLILRAAP
jgi:heat shock protein HslJ